MTRRSWERACFWRAVEAAEGEGAGITAERAVEATLQTRGELTSAAVDPFRWQPAVWRFLERRTRWLEAWNGGGAGVGGADGEGWAWVRERLRLRRVPGAVVVAGAVAAGVGGFVLTRLGNERELNLLALPLVGLLLWNAVVMVVAVVLEWRGAAHLPGAAGQWGRWRSEGRVEATGESDELRWVARAEAEFQKLTRGVVAAGEARGVRRLLHAGAALVALGSVAGLFAQGWSREYRVVGESTLLNEARVTQLAGTVFGPASRVFGVEIPLEAIPGMRRGQGLETRAGEALPWLQLYAGTLLLGVVVPRLLLALASLMLERRALRRAILEQGWGAHAQRLLRRVEGGGQRVLVLAGGSARDERARQRWTAWVGAMWGGRLELQWEGVEEDEQERWLEAWQPEEGRVVAVFHLAVTPELEVQREWMLGVRARLRASHLEPEIVALLDATGLADKWSAEKRAGREALWLTTLAGAVERVWSGDEKGVRPLERPQKPL